MEITPDATLATIVTGVRGAPRILEGFGLDYCCHGNRSLADACAEASLNLGEVIDQLSAEFSRDPAAADLPEDTVELVDHILSTHHRYLDAELPRLEALAIKVEGVHGDRHPELHRVRELCTALRDDLTPHMLKEENVLFPLIRSLVTGEPSTGPTMPVDRPVAMMMMEHEATGEILEELRNVTSGYEAPGDACGSYQALYAGLADVERDTHMHIHKENNVLFPKALSLVAVG
ncbi:MAG: iron-sulfur cluster repair di-iron protein [Microthrixaceae bacterium]|nr:iron-sulfur cluster repair di-iron protein [Microthrixaceae bacterium]MCO5311468.1 iron-sulfur cluster repair di-iron protein [Microthrixaceae bacterium]HPB45485.1 iron-sulfur cluster repair di-iron protein [Microthrixaceae bacterium]